MIANLQISLKLSSGRIRVREHLNHKEEYTLALKHYRHVEARFNTSYRNGLMFHRNEDWKQYLKTRYRQTGVKQQQMRNWNKTMWDTLLDYLC